MALFQKYCGYAAHVSRTVYHDPQEWEQKREETEQQWPEFMTSTLALSRPRYQSADAQQMDGPTWRRLFLEKDVEALQQLKQHHVHLLKVENGPRLPLDHCRDRRHPTNCKSGFPREKRLTNGPVLVCKGLAEQMEMPIKGKRSGLGQIWGPCNDANLNGNHPAMLAALRCNGDVQLPYRFPITEELHEACGRCTASCPEDQGARETTRQAQINQAAQSGYACDYGNKRLPIAMNEVGEWQKSQKELETELENNPSSGYVGARTSKRIMTQCFCRGVCRGACECANLLDHANKSDPTAAEAIKTAQTAELSLSFGLQLLQAATLQTPLPAERAKMQADNRDVHNNKGVVQCPQNWTLYGNRGRDSRVHSLSAYEFARYYHCRQAYFPWTAKDQDQAAQAAVEAAAASSSQPRTEQRMFHALLSESGKQKRADKVSKRNLQAGVDYVIQEQGGEDWMPLGKGSLAQAYRHDWIIKPRNRPHAPVPYGALGSRSQDEHAKKMLLLFCPWTSNPEDATESVPYIGQLRTPEMTSWREALRLAWTRAGGFPTEELKRYVLSYAFVYCLPRTLQPDANLAANSDNEGMEDVIFHFEKDELDEAMKTRVRGAGAAQGQAPAADEAQEEQTHEATAAAPPNTTTQHDLTVQMINLSHSFWLGRASQETDLARRHARQHRQRVVLNWPDGVVSTERMLRDASKSRNRYEEEATVATQGLDNAGGRPAATRTGQRKASERVADQRPRAKQPQPGAARVLAAGRAESAGRIRAHASAPDDPKQRGAAALAAARGSRHGQVARAQLRAAGTLPAAARLRAGHRLPGDRLPGHERGGHQRPNAAPSLPAQQKQELLGHDLQAGHGAPHRALAVAHPGRGEHGERPAHGAGGTPRPERRPDRVAVEARRTCSSAATSGSSRRPRAASWRTSPPRCERPARPSREPRPRTLSSTTARDSSGKARSRACLREAKFLNATIVVSNNDAKYQINKDRAKAYARDAQTPLHWSVAQDKAGAEALQTQDCDKEAKIRWLQYHDMDTENLYDILPLTDCA